ncbi:MAG TPA: hypothetical protein DCS66_24930 [Flavobacteriaceae bacterium]|nr:hypothetical protein [Flavobacteriaceae bacterium]HAT67805.1 hypothetical protein [Flavobacteriaceae bacterium]
MIKFFRKIRQNLLSEGKTVKYLKYAIGEIVLVVIGILIALAINNWNDEKQRKNGLLDTFESILGEIAITRSMIIQDSIQLDAVILTNQKSLYILKTKNVDSAYQLVSTLGGLVDLQSLKFELPNTMRFIEDENLKKVENSALKQLALKLKSEISFLDFYTDYTTTQYQSIIEPYVAKNLNYAEIQNSTTMINTGQKIDYVELFEDIELSNILNLKLEADIAALRYVKRFNLTLEKVEKEIRQELRKK